MKKLSQCWLDIQNIDKKTNFPEEIRVAESYLTLADYFGQHNQTTLFTHYIRMGIAFHQSKKNYVEAASALELLAERYKQTEFMNEETTPKIVQNYQDAISAYKKGKAWERAISLYKTIRIFYKNSPLKIAECEEAMAELFTLIQRKQRTFPRYFLIIFYGNGFKEENGSVYVYRDAKNTKSTFEERMFEGYTEAKEADPTVASVILTSSTLPSSITDINGKFLYIKKIYPHPIKLEKHQQNMPLAVQDAYRHFRVDTFLQHDVLVAKTKELDHTLIIVDDAFPNASHRVGAKIIKLK